MPNAYRKNVIFAAEVYQTFLVDGFVAGRWSSTASPKEAVLELRPFRRLSRSERAAADLEAERLIRFIAPEAGAHGVRA